MAIVQISRITHRKGLSENLPQLAGAELGWVVDERRLYIGNGTLAEGAPAVGNTEILTQYSNILDIADNYTYKGAEAGYTVVTGLDGSNVQRTLQEKLDDFASVRDFGAVGDGVVDDTEAINRALYQLFCRETQAQIRRSLFFPAGVYRVTQTIKIPPYAKLVGEGPNSTTIKMDVSGDSSYGTYVARTADNEQQIGVSIGNNGATAPQFIDIYDMTFQSSEDNDIFLAENVTQLAFHSVNFTGPLGEADLTSAADDTAGVRFSSTTSYPTQHVLFNSCCFTGTTYGMKTDAKIQGVTVSNGRFHTLYRGVDLGTGTPVDGGPIGTRIVHNLFDKIAAEGVAVGDINYNVTSSNMFLDVGNNFQGLGSPIASVIDFNGENNLSIGDVFQRDDTDDANYPRIDTNNKEVFALDNAQRIKFGLYSQEVGRTTDLTATGSATTIFTLSTSKAEGFTVKYQFRDPLSYSVRYGTLNFVAADADDSTETLTYTDDYVENTPSGLVLSVTQSGSTISVKYTASADGTFKYTTSYLV